MIVEWIRDGLVEEFHEGIIVRQNDTTSEPYYIRSCAKPLQASLLIDYNAGLTEEELALCSGSHAGEKCHIEIAQGILDKYKLKESDLKCGVHAPLSRTAQDKLLMANEHATVLHNNCSGKHLGFLVVCRINGWDLKDYDEPSHPLQKSVKNKIYQLCDIHKDFPMTTDGCGVPIVSMPLVNLLIGYKNLVKLYPQIINAIKNNPYVFGGENRLDTEIIQKTKNIIAKVGAGGLCVVYNLQLSDGFVVKMYDASMEARRVAVFNEINNLGWGIVNIDNTIKTLNGKIVGEIVVKE
jgi:L-asparaginase II